MSPKDGKTLSPVVPVSPTEPKEAAVADPGAKAEAGTSNKATRKVSPGTTPVGSSSTSTTATDPESHWVSVELVDNAGAPVPNEEYRIKLPDGQIVGGRLNEKGQAKVENVSGGQCEVNFPRLHGDEWSPA